MRRLHVIMTAALAVSVASCTVTHRPIVLYSPEPTIEQLAENRSGCAKLKAEGEKEYRKCIDFSYYHTKKKNGRDIAKYQSMPVYHEAPNLYKYSDHGGRVLPVDDKYKY